MTDSKTRIREYYDSLADSYEQLYGEEQAAKHKETLTLAGKGKFNLLVDVGCGTGGILLRTSSNYSLAVGTDISQRMIQIAKRRARNEKTEFIMSDCSSLPLRNRVADIVLSISVLRSDSGRDQFRELARIVKPGGTLLVTIFHPENAGKTENGSYLPQSEVEVPLTDRETLHLVRVIESRRRRQTNVGS